MAYNSDGYIMIDFAEVDFSKTNQTIDGLFDRCQKVIGTNKFVIVINANNKTPLPSTVCITNGQYVIESVLFTFSISSSDNLHITKKTTPEELIDDNHITLKTTWSSNKIDSELDEKQDTLTAGDNITIENNVISAADCKLKVKSFTYTGTGSTPNTITFPETPIMILGIYGMPDSTSIDSMNPCVWGSPRTSIIRLYTNTTVNIPERAMITSYSGNSISLSGDSATWSLNTNDITYTVYYI